MLSSELNRQIESIIRSRRNTRMTNDEIPAVGSVSYILLPSTTSKPFLVGIGLLPHNDKTLSVVTCLDAHEVQNWYV
jgi:hypothetical protein